MPKHFFTVSYFSKRENLKSSILPLIMRLAARAHRPAVWAKYIIWFLNCKRVLLLLGVVSPRQFLPMVATSGTSFEP